MDKGPRRIIHVNRRIMKTDAVEPKGKERSTEVEIDGQTSKTETVKLALPGGRGVFKSWSLHHCTHP